MYKDATSILFSRSQLGMDDETFLNEFSIATPGNRQIYSRAFVSHNGLNNGDGVWYCSKDRIPNCLHIHRAQNKLQQLLQRNPTVAHESDASEIPDGTFTNRSLCQ